MRLKYNCGIAASMAPRKPMGFKLPERGSEYLIKEEIRISKSQEFCVGSNDDDSLTFLN